VRFNNFLLFKVVFWFFGFRLAEELLLASALSPFLGLHSRNFILDYWTIRFQ